MSLGMGRNQYVHFDPVEVVLMPRRHKINKRAKLTILIDHTIVDAWFPAEHGTNVFCDDVCSKFAVELDNTVDTDWRLRKIPCLQKSWRD